MAANPDTRAAAPYAPKWDADPMVLCSRHGRMLSFPTLLLLREPTEADKALLAAPLELGKIRDESMMTVLAGVNFLGALTTAWDPLMFRAASHQAAPKAAPPTDRCILVAPYSRNVNLADRVGFKDRETGVVKPEAVHAAWMRVVTWLQAQEAAQVARDGQANVPMFATEQGYDAPELVLCKLSEVLKQQTEAGEHGYRHALGAIPHARDGSHLGALHDYAVRSPASWTLAQACRTRAAAAPGLLRATA